MADSFGSQVPSASPGLSWGLRLKVYLRCSEEGPRAQYQAHQVGQAQVAQDGHEDAHTGRDEVPQGRGLGIHTTCAETSAAEGKALGPRAPTGLTTLIPLLISFIPQPPPTSHTDKLRDPVQGPSPALHFSPLPYLSCVEHLLCACYYCMLLTICRWSSQTHLGGDTDTSEVFVQGPQLGNSGTGI